jgi:hypothetical protein
MNITLMFGLACVVIFAVGMLIGQGLNGRAQIDRDKWRAGALRDLNDRKRDLELAARSTHWAPSKE